MDKSLIRCALILVLSFGLQSCKDDEAPGNGGGGVEVKEGRILMVNEGNFQWGNATLASIDQETGEFEDELYKKANGIPLGDVFQSVTRYEDSYFLVVNNSGKIVRIDTADFKVKKTFTGFTSPRYILPTSAGTSLVSDLYAGEISIIESESGKVLSTVPLPGWSEQMMALDNDVWITNRESKFVYVLDLNSNRITDSLEVAYQSQSMVLDKNGELWVLCMGDQAKKEKGGLFKIDPKKKEVELKLLFEDNATPLHIRLNPTSDTLYFLNKELYRMGIFETALPTTPYINLDGNNPYALDIDPRNGRIYVSDAIDFIQKSKILIYSSGNQPAIIQRLTGGVLCNKFIFPKKN